VSLDLKIELATVLVILCIAVIGIRFENRNWRTRQKLNDIHDETKGVRIRLERHAEESTDERHRIHEENKLARSQIYKMFVEFLNYMKR
jgi:hypothetical protein